VPRKKHTHSGFTSSGEHFENLSRDLLGILYLTQDSNLHVVNEQSDSLWIAHLFQLLGDLNAVSSFHVRDMSPVAKI
jgi:hypothetical protein